MATTIKFLSKKQFKSAVLLTGLPGIGLVGKIAADYMIRQLKPEKIAEIHADFFPPSVQTNNGIVELIKDELHYASLNGQDFIFLSGPVQPALDGRGPMDEHFEFSRQIISTLKERGVVEVCTLAGINVGEKRMQGEPGVVVACTSKKKLDEWKKLGATSERPIGLISGVAGLLLGIGREEGIEGSCLMGETNAHLVYGDPGAAKAVVEMLIKKYGFAIEMKEMEKESKEIEKAFSQLSKQIDEPDDHPQHLTYVR